MPPLVLYHSPVSPFSRSVLLLARYLKLDVNVTVMDLQEKKEQLSPEFLKINPQHCVPTVNNSVLNILSISTLIILIEIFYFLLD